MTETDPPLFALLNEIGIIEQLARNRFERAQPDGLRLPHFAVLNHLARLGDGRSPARIARAFQLGKPAMTNTLQRLEARGFVTLEPDPDDARAKLVRLTDAGRARRDEAVRQVQADLGPMAFRLSADPAALLPALRELRTALDRDRG
ncbi:MAG: MarR family transcriptional regulator [Acetobacteraceae bacterium]|nr:MarR family transcriptional regulator [Acetobacteraceae bacterium]